jgi:hypothetical protein
MQGCILQLSPQVEKDLCLPFISQEEGVRENPEADIIITIRPAVSHQHPKYASIAATSFLHADMLY